MNSPPRGSMRKAILLAAFLVACTKAEAPPSDTAAAAAPPPAPPAKLTPAELAGSWNGVSKLEGTDSVVARWVTTSTTDSTGTLTYAGTTTAVAYARMFDADSVMMTSAAFAAPGAKKGAPKVQFRSVGRLVDGKFVGHSMTVLAAKPDSVLSRRTFEATKTP